MAPHSFLYRLTIAYQDRHNKKLPSTLCPGWDTTHWRPSTSWMLLESGSLPGFRKSRMKPVNIHCHTKDYHTGLVYISQLILD